MTAISRRLMSARGSRQGMWMLPLLIALAIALWLSLETAQFLNGENLLNLVPQAMPLVITAVGQMFVILLGGLDLSVGSMISFTTAVLALGGPAWVLVPAVFALAALVGFSNGFIITRFNVHPIIATLSTQYILLGITRVLRSLLVQVSPTDPVTFVSLSVLLSAVAVLACWIPARRAMRVHPVVALRYE